MKPTSTTKATHASKAEMIPVEYLRVPEKYTSPSRKVDDEILQNSVKLTGVQQPLIVVRISDVAYWVIDGTRRLRIAKSLGIPSLPCVIDLGVDEVDDETEYRNRVRFILDEHRQDLLPSQRAALIKKLQVSFGMTGKQVGLYLGVTPATITNWVLIDKMIPELQKAIDYGTVTVHAARAFAGITQTGQKQIWENHRDTVLQMSGIQLHRWVRDTFNPTEHREMYEAPDVVIRQLTRKNKPRVVHKRTAVSADEKRNLLKDVDAKKIELEDKQLQTKEFETHINSAISVIEALRKDKELWNSLPNVVRNDFQEFAVRYVP